MKRYIPLVADVLSTTFVLGIGGVLLWGFLSSPAPAAAPAPPRAVEPVTGLHIAAERLTHMRGRGPLVLVEFTDYECPFCARHAANTRPAIDREMVESGAIRHVVFNFPLAFHQLAAKAGEAAECAAQQGRFWEMHESLFEAPMAIDLPALRQRAGRLGLDQAAFDDCLTTSKTAALVRAHVAEGERLGVRSTPSFFLGRVDAGGGVTLVKKINGAVPFEMFERAVGELSAATTGD